MSKLYDFSPKEIIKNKQAPDEFTNDTPVVLRATDTFSVFLSAIGNQRIVDFFENLQAQAKLQVSTPGDRFEQEADNIAHNIVSMNDAQITNKTAAPPVQKKNFAPGNSSLVNAAMESSIRKLQNAGVPLKEAQLEFFQSRLNADLSSVRVHNSQEGQTLAHSLHAKAFTVNNHIVFSKNQYQPDSMQGRELIAHELVHILQESGIVYCK